jgi:hypothetical protein
MKRPSWPPHPRLERACIRDALFAGVLRPAAFTTGVLKL